MSGLVDVVKVGGLCTNWNGDPTGLWSVFAVDFFEHDGRVAARVSLPKTPTPVVWGGWFASRELAAADALRNWGERVSGAVYVAAADLESGAAEVRQTRGEVVGL